MKKVYILCLFTFIVFFITKKTFSQCTNCGSQYPSTTQSTTSTTMTTISTCMYGSDYVVCNVTSGTTYTWETCGDTDFDTQLSLIQGTGCGGTSLAYNDDGCGTQSTITWTATFTGVVTVLVSEYNCTSNTDCMTLQWSASGGTSVATAGDCADAINVCTNLGFQVDANGIGATNEIPASGSLGNPLNNNPGGSGHSGCLQVGEKNSTWMIVNIGSDGLLEFNFGGSSQAGYYDWIMYPYNSSSCSAIPNNVVAPVRCNWNATSSGGTGLSPSYTTNANFEPPLPVLCGEQYIICFSNYSSALTNVPLQFSGTATVSCLEMTCAGAASCNPNPGSVVNQDCNGAIPVCQNYFCQESSFVGTGNVSGEIPTGNTCLGSGEKNDSWYIFTVQQSGNVNFTITPNSTTDDYDWAVFNLTNATCAQIPLDASLDVSCNYSSNIGCGGLTGPNGETVNCDAQNEPVIPVVAGETYVVNVSNFSSSQSGYSLDFSASTAVIFDNIPPALDILTTTPSCGATSVTIRFTEQVLCSSVQACDFTITGPGGPYTVTGVTGTACAAGGTQEVQFTLNVTPAMTTTGNYNVNLVAGCGYVQDLCGNVATDGSLPFTITGLVTSQTQTNVSCYNGNNGIASVTITSGSGSPYTYNWSNGTTTGPTATTTSSISGLTAVPGTYSVTTTNSTGCSVINSFTITQPLQITLALTPAEATCGASNGQIAVSVSNGYANYNYTCPPAVASNNNANSSYTFTGLAPSSYTVNVTDGHGCTASGTTTIINTGSVTSTFTYNGNHCAGTEVANQYNFTNTGSTGVGITHSWTFPSGTPTSSTAENPIGITWTTSGTYTITHTVTQGSCTSTSTMNIAVLPNPVPNVLTTNANCAGGSTGIATSNPTGGSTFSYLWSTGATSQAITGLAAGSYTVTVTNTDNCAGIQTVTITEPLPLTLVTTRTDVTCYGLCDGTASVTASGGSGSYTYSWSGGNTPTANNTGNLCVGTFTVTVTDASTPACFQTANVSISQPDLITLIFTTVNTTCGNNNGEATVTATNGFPAYTYNWGTSPAQTTQTATGLATNAYPVTVTDSHGCSVTGSANVSSDDGPTASIVTSADVSCFGGSTGSATATASGAATPITYLWSAGTAPTNQLSISGLPSGTHTFTATDNNGCTATATVTIIQPTALSATTSPIGANCGQATGSIQANPSGGTGPYTYAWNSTPTQTTQIASNLPPAAYTVIVTDANLCSTTANGTISDIPGVLVSVKSSTQPTCNGDCDGTASLEIVGGLPGYSIVVSNGYTASTSSINFTIPNLCAGTFTLTVTDANSCQSVETFTISQPDAVTASISASTNVNCNGGSTGAATVTGTGGTETFTADWNTIPAQNTLTATGLVAGTYNVTITDGNGCTANASVLISEPTAITLSTTKTDAHCSQADGSANVSAIGGTITTGYTYLWSGGTIPTQANCTGLAAGTYSVIVTDNNSCTATTSVTIGDLPGGTASISAFSNVTCYGQSNGSATVSMGGGLAPFTYSWSTTPPQTTVTATNLDPGVYTVNVTDANSCIATATVTITQPAQLSNMFTVTNASCNGQCDGQITSSVMGGTSPYIYQWSNLQSTATISNLCDGEYTLTAIDNLSCTATFTATVTEPAPIEITGTAENANCNQSDGSITTIITGGTIPYQFHWTSGEDTQSLSNVPSGTYTLAVIDASGCNQTSTFQINNISGPTATISESQNVLCNGAANGYATVYADGGSLQFNYVWSTNPAQYSATASNLDPGTYNVIVTDIISNCTANTTVIITEPSILSNTTQITPPLCNGDCDGSATVTPSGGTSPYTYQWFGGGNAQTSATNTGLCAGSYTIIITDTNSCTKMETVNVTQPAFLSVVATATPLSCFGICNGTTNVTASGGIAPYSYQWSANTNNQTTQQAIALCPDTYSCIITDNNDCSTSVSTIVTTPPKIVVQVLDLQHVKCFSESTGRITLSVTGGSPGYTYNWSNGATTQNIINIPYGNYCVTVTDLNGCSKDTCFIISQPPLLQVSATAHEESCYGLCDGYITSNIQGGQPPYAYLWSNFDTQATADSLCPGAYAINITDFNNCIATSNATVTGHDILAIMTVNTDTATCGQANGSAVISALGGTYSFTYQWPTGINSISSIANNLAAGAYTVTVIDANGCRDSLQINISNADGPIIDSFQVQHITCYGYQNGSIQVFYHGSTISYSLGWNTSPPITGVDEDMVTNLGPGTYSVVITDGHGCVASGSRTIIQPTQLQSAITNHTNTSCYGTCNGTATVMGNGGTNPYSFNWTGGGTTSTVSNLCAGNYSVTLTDANLCTSISSTTITQPDSIHITANVQNATCNGSNNGQIVLSVTGGTGYFYNWLPNVSSNSVAAPLSPGTYSVLITDYYDQNCTKTASYLITEPNLIQTTLGSTPTSCGQNNGTAFVSSNVTGGTAPYNFTWSPGNSTNDTVYNAASGSYQFQITDANNCLFNSTVAVNAITPPIIFSIVTSNVSCPGMNDGSALITIKDGSQPYSYDWNPFIGNDSIVDNFTMDIYGLSAGNYNVTIADDNGCLLQTALIVTEPSPIIIHADGSRWICEGQTTTITANASGGTPPYSFSWIGLPSSNAVQIVNPTSTTTYNVYATDNRACVSDTAGVTIYVYPPVIVNLIADTTRICKNDQAHLEAIPSGGNGGPYNFYWYDLQDTVPFAIRDVSPPDTTTYIVYAVDNCGSPSIADSITIYVLPVPQVAVIVDKMAGCEPLEVFFRNIATTTDLQYLWNFNDVYSNNNSSLDPNPSHLFTHDGNYNVTLTIKTGDGCTATDDQIITVYPKPIANFTLYPEFASLFHSTIEFNDISDGIISNRLWNFGDNRYSGMVNPEHTYEQAGIYNVMLTVRTDHNCVDSITKQVEIRDEFTLYVPTAFDPNSPINREFYPQGVGIDEKNYHLWIFDRWGELIFETIDWNERWSGKFMNKGEYVKSGTYVWYIWVKDKYNKAYEKNGYVTVIR
ncbi:MAG: hypothetical protein A2275_10965 [Bacteroidetes bacterium RIFOXYA12_FULL_35_11]|nr:MAG: hypothetical protein A2X01_08445 [Bacteroidetes bacterium GWF2_35_48]OFY74594.1 MAG: hypothetical protein A2275_10965 [Bacteroidetes bacterium RIFOXYA12_FULL_35_11]